VLVGIEFGYQNTIEPRDDDRDTLSRVDERRLDNPSDTNHKNYMDMRGSLLQNIHQNPRKLAYNAGTVV